MSDDPVARLYAGLRHDETLAVDAMGESPDHPHGPGGRAECDSPRCRHDIQTGPPATLWKVAAVRRAADIATAAIADTKSTNMQRVLVDILGALADIYPLDPGAEDKT